MVHCVFPGAFKDRQLRAVADSYFRRLSAIWPVKVHEIEDEEGAILRFLRKQGKGTIVSLDARGMSMDSDAFTRWVTREPKDLVFVVWGAEGPTPDCRALATQALSLSPMTTSHEMARVFLLEQLYRAATLLKGHPYAK
jgi:23S rRNA (pseudouridine1915-N3)-methyltransferase